MPVTDLPDWTRQVIIRYEGGFIGLEELATRLGFIGPWDLRGNVILMEDFESELTEWIDDSVGGSSATRSSRHKFSGDWSLRLYNAGNVALPLAAGKRWFHFPGTSKYAAFARFCFNEDCQYFYLMVDLWSSTEQSEVVVGYDLPSTTLHVLTTGSVYTVVDSALDLSSEGYKWYPVLVTFDLETGYYDKLYFADEEYDISSLQFDTISGAVSPRGLITIASVAAAASAFTTYVDDIIVAKNVP